MEKRKLDDDKLKAVVSAVIEEKKYDLDIACNVLDLVGGLKQKISEDFEAIDSIKRKLEGVVHVEKVRADLDTIVDSIKATEAKVDKLYEYLSPKK